MLFGKNIVFLGRHDKKLLFGKNILLGKNIMLFGKMLCFRGNFIYFLEKYLFNVV